MMINVTYVVLFVLLVALSSVPVEAGLTKFFKKLGNQISDAGERLVKHVNVSLTARETVKLPRITVNALKIA